MSAPDSPPPLPPPERARLKALLALAFLAAAAALFARFPPAVWPVWPRCLLHEATGLHCPGCGLTRAVSALLRGDCASAFGHHPVFWLLAIPCAAWGVRAVAYALWHDRFPAGPSVRLLTWGGVIFVVAGVLRNLPGFAFLGP